MASLWSLFGRLWASKPPQFTKPGLVFRSETGPMLRIHEPGQPLVFNCRAFWLHAYWHVRARRAPSHPTTPRTALRAAPTNNASRRFNGRRFAPLRALRIGAPIPMVGLRVSKAIGHRNLASPVRLKSGTVGKSFCNQGRLLWSCSRIWGQSSQSPEVHFELLWAVGATWLRDGP